MFSQNLIPNGDFELGPDSSSAGWIYDFDTLCNLTGSVLGPDLWSVVNSSPDRLVEGDIPCNWDNDTAQSGKSYINLGWEEAGKATLLFPLQKDSLYQLSCNLSLETYKGTELQPSRITIKFNNGGDSLVSPYISNSQWQYYDTIFKASANSTEIELRGIQTFSSGANIDNVYLVKVITTSVNDYPLTQNKINVYPNPSSGQILIHCNITDKIKIYNTHGQEMYFTSLFDEQNSIHLDLAHLPKGIYSLQIITKHEFITGKIVLTN